jgi:hypothetical protein
MKEKTKNSRQEEPPSSDINEEASPKKRSLIGGIRKILFRTLIYSVLFIFLLITSAGLVLEYYFPAEEARLFAEGHLTKTLKLPLKIQKLDFSLFRGLQLDGVTLGFATNPVARVKKVVLDYKLTRLLQGKLVINQVLIDQPQLTAISKDGVWNFQPLLELTKPSPPPAKEDKSKLLLPEVDLKELAIRNASARLDQDGKLSTHIEGLNLEAQGKVGLNAFDLQLKVLLTPDPNKPSNISYQSTEGLSFQSRVFSNLNFSANDLNRLLVHGVFGLQNNRVSLPLPPPDITVEMDVAVQPELLNLNKLQMSLGNNNRIKVSGDVANFSKDPVFKLMIDEASFQLKDLLGWGKQWAPPLSAHGLLNAKAVKVSGRLPGFVLNDLDIHGGTLSAKNLWVKYPEQNVRLEDMNADLELKEVVLKNSKFEKASLDIKMQLKKALLQKVDIKDWKQALSLTAKGKEDVFFEFSTDLKSAHYDHPETKEIFLPVFAEGSGHLKKSDLNNLKLSYRLGILANGKLAGTVKDFGKSSMKLSQNISLNLTEIASRLPKNLAMGQSFKGIASAQTSITGKLDGEYSPVEFKGQANLQLEGLTTQLKQPSIKIKNLNTQVNFPFEFNTKLGAQVPYLNIHTDFQNAEVLDTFQVNAFELDTKMVMKEFHNLKPEFGTFPIQTESRIALGSLNSQQPALSLADLKSDIMLKTDLQAEDMRNTHAEGNLSFKKLSAMKMLKTGEWLSRFNLDVHDKSLTRVRLSQKTKIHKPSFQQDDLILDLESVQLETLSRQNLKEGEVEIDRLLLQSPNLVNAQLKATLKDWGKAFEIDGKVESLELGPLWDRMPTAFKSGMQSLKAGGTLGIAFKTKGNLPASINESKSIAPANPLWVQLLAPSKANAPSRIEVNTEIQLHNGFLEDPDKKIRAEALNTKTMLTFAKGHTELKGNFSGLLKGLAENPLNPEFEFHYVLDNLSNLRIRQHHLKLDELGVQHSLEGHLKGLKPFITGQRPARINEFLNRLDIQLANTNTIDISHAITANSGELFGDINGKGFIESKIKFHQAAGEFMNLDGSLGFDKFSLQLPSGIALNNLNGTFPFTKSLQLGPGQAKEESIDFFPGQKTFFTSLRDFSHYKNIIRADALEAKGQVLKNLGLDVVFKDNRLMAENFIFDVLEGSVGGNLFLIQDRQGPVIKFSTKFAGIDSSKLMARTADKNIDSKVDGNLQVKLKINTGSEDQPVSLSQLSVKIAITRIGAQTLDRLLLFIDPEESKPAIMDTRAKLKLATPHRVEIILENGNLNVEAWLNSDLLGIFKAPELKRVPIAALKHFSTIHEQLQTLKDLEQISNYLSVRGLQFEDEKMILNY